MARDSFQKPFNRLFETLAIVREDHAYVAYRSRSDLEFNSPLPPSSRFHVTISILV